LAKQILKSKYTNFLYVHDIERIMQQLLNDFPDLVQVMSIGKTYQNHDIPVFTFADPEGEVPINERPAILLTGGTHARELTTVQMVFYSMFRMLHGHVHGDVTIANLLRQHTFFFMPAFNIDSINNIWETWVKFGDFEMKRKNMNPTYGDAAFCDNDPL
jgi:murein tripeptide amidase MpaA